MIFQRLRLAILCTDTEYTSKMDMPRPLWTNLDYFRSNHSKMYETCVKKNASNVCKFTFASLLLPVIGALPVNFRLEGCLRSYNLVLVGGPIFLFAFGLKYFFNFQHIAGKY